MIYRISVSLKDCWSQDNRTSEQKDSRCQTENKMLASLVLERF